MDISRLVFKREGWATDYNLRWTFASLVNRGLPKHVEEALTRYEKHRPNRYCACVDSGRGYFVHETVPDWVIYDESPPRGWSLLLALGGFLLLPRSGGKK